MPKPAGFHAAMTRALDGVAPDARLFNTCGSTNDEARSWARDGAPHLAVVAADEQTAGRGRRGRTWLATRGESLLASIVLRPELSVERWTILPLLVGVAVVRAIESRTKVIAELKWPNDVLVDGRKLAGILLEAEPPTFAIAGIGLNASQTHFDEKIKATSLAREGAVRLDRADLLAGILTELPLVLAEPVRSLDEYRKRCVTLGMHVEVRGSDATVSSGIAGRVQDDGTLWLIDGDGRESVVTAGDVTQMRPWFGPRFWE